MGGDSRANDGNNSTISNKRLKSSSKIIISNLNIGNEGAAKQGIDFNGATRI